jgi:dihydrodipicolinate synthase/N-acetylneuraminate lyase
MRQQDGEVVFPAITTPFLDTLAVAHRAPATDVTWLADHGCGGIVAARSLARVP